jgi:hypothetical protein
MDYRQVLDKIQESLFDIKKALCANNLISVSPYYGGSVSATLQASSLSTGTIAEAQQIRWVDIKSDADTTLEITVTLHDGSSWVHRTYRDSHRIRLPLTASPVQSVNVEELDNTSVVVSINYLT